MPFYRRTNDILETATVSVSAPTYQLSEEEHADHAYPVDGWYWFASLDAALDGLPRAGELLPVTLSEWRAAAHAARSAERLLRQTGGFPLDGHTYASDREESIPLLTGATISAQMALAQGPEVAEAFAAALGEGWRDVTGKAVITTAMGILGLHAAFVAWGAACDSASQLIAADIEAAQDIAALEAIIAGIPGDKRWPA